MKQNKFDFEISEDNKLPLTFDYIEFYQTKSSSNPKDNSPEKMSCDEFQTDFLVRSKPIKRLTRLIWGILIFIVIF